MLYALSFFEAVNDLILFSLRSLMYCPKCSQQQVSDELRFCPRSGFPRTAVRKLAVVAAGAPVEREAEALRGE
jgi:hypothetical protein